MAHLIKVGARSSSRRATQRALGSDSDSETNYAPCRSGLPQKPAAPYDPSGRMSRVEQPVARSNCTTQRSSSAAQPAEQWTIWASHEQVEVPKDKQTHTRPLSLPYTIDGWIMGNRYWQLQYAGHGQSKTVYRLTDKLVLKLCEKQIRSQSFSKHCRQAVSTQWSTHRVSAKCLTVLDGLLKHGTRG